MRQVFILMIVVVNLRIIYIINPALRRCILCWFGILCNALSGVSIYTLTNLMIEDTYAMIIVSVLLLAILTLLFLSLLLLFLSSLCILFLL